ncbi:MAG TPA: deoxyribose-phosphate aldolase [Terriglobales bacterium]|nr:deoxyribose-phosphate aldolase [Terriglobales bacterium]
MSTLTTVSGRAEINTRDWRSLARCLDSTLLRPETTSAQVAGLCREAAHYSFATVFVHPSYVPLAASLLQGTPVRTGAPVGFPLGANTTSVKRYEAAELLRLGARELDMVMNIGALKSRERQRVELDLRAVVEVAHGAGALLKVILETCLLTLDEKIVACELSVAAGADFVKTSTGLAGGGATAEDVTLMRGVVGERCGVKAAGGIRTLADALAMIDAGANRLGTSTASQIVRELGAPESPR